jgi:hypothetical protein
MQLFTVELTTEIVVVAEDESDAIAHARESLRDLDDDHYAAHAAPMRHMPSNWDLSCIPYGDGDPTDRDRKIGGWISLGAAPQYPVKP